MLIVLAACESGILALHHAPECTRIGYIKVNKVNQAIKRQISILFVVSSRTTGWSVSRRI